MTEKTDAWMPLWIGAYLADTQHLTRDEHGGYLLLLMAYWRARAALPDDDKRLAAIVKASPAEWKRLRPTMAEFFTVRDAAWWHKRVEAEIVDADTRKAGAVSKAQAAAEARWGKGGKQPSSSPPSNASSIPQALPEECPTPSPTPLPPEEKTSHLSVAPARQAEPPDCPHLEILALWAEVLPSMPQHLQHEWKGARADHLRVRWRETAVLKGWPDKAAGLGYLRKLFAHVGRSAFLTGRARQTDPNKRPFVIELEWLVNPTNWAKVHEGKYHQDAA